MRRFLTLLVTLVVFGVGSALGQVKQVTGVVTSADDKQSIPGVSVFVKEAPSVGASTDINGKYTLKNVPANAKHLVFRFVGYTSVEVPIQDVVNAILEPESKKLDEVVVTAYGVQKKSSLTGAITALDSKKLERTSNADVSKSLEGMVAGVTVSSASGAPGEGTKIRIRGIGSLNASNAPLVILDGAPYDSDINTINPTDIETYSVLKDAAASALYGARGANGVVIITTKKGKQGQTVVHFDGKVGYNFRGVDDYDMITNPGQYYETAWKSLYNVARFDAKFKKENGVSRPATPAEAAAYASSNLYSNVGGYLIYKNVPAGAIVGVDGKLNPNAKEYVFEDADWNDWHKALFKPQMRQEYNVSISKGNEHSSTFFSVGYLSDKGYNKNSYFDRITTRMNHNTDIYSWLKFSNKTQFAFTKRNINASGSTMANTFSFTRSMPPIHPIYKHGKDGKIMYDEDGNKMFEDGAAIDGVSLVRKEMKNLNIVATQDDDMNRYNSYILNNTANLTALLPHGFTLSTNVTYSGEFTNRTYRQAPFGDAAMYGGRLRKYEIRQDGINFNQLVDWNKSLLDNELNVAFKLGHESYMMKQSYMRGGKSNLFDQWSEDLSTAAKIEDLTSTTTTYNLEGYFGQATADYKSRYYLSVSARRDGSSVFHPDHRWGTFWSTGFSWRISNESFFEPFVDKVDNLKLRLSYGAQGNDYLYLPDGISRSWTPYQNIYDVTSDGSKFGVVPSEMGNERITWEKNLNFNAAIEFSIAKGLLSGEVEFFQRTTSDMLFNVPVPASTGFKTMPMNVGKMKNTGVELTLRASIIRTDNLRWSVDGNLTHYKNKLTTLPEQFRKTGIRRGSQLLTEGGSIYDFNLVKWAGVDPEDGNSLYWMRGKDANGKLGEFTAQPWNENLLETSRQTVGTSLPDLQGGFGTSLETHGIDFSMQFSYGVGGKVLDNTYATLMNPSTFGSGWHKDLLNSWVEGVNKSTSIPRLQKDNRDLQQSSDRFLTSGSYLAFRNVMLGYTLPTKWIKRMHLNSIRVYGVVDNVNIWSARKGLDPRMFIDGTGENVYSPIRTVSAGLTVNF